MDTIFLLFDKPDIRIPKGKISNKICIILTPFLYTTFAVRCSKLGIKLLWTPRTLPYTAFIFSCIASLYDYVTFPSFTVCYFIRFCGGRELILDD